MLRSTGVLKGHVPASGEVLSSMSIPLPPRHQPAKAPFQVKPLLQLPSPMCERGESVWDNSLQPSGVCPSMRADAALKLGAGRTGTPIERPPLFADAVPSQVLLTALQQLSEAAGKSQSGFGSDDTGSLSDGTRITISTSTTESHEDVI
mmetsp:Transcript_6131/g.13625  ORF Transcript_6131/g.13625 Transcript_6131/m.13625 type:complete len:149 (-) Transcript_6131:75-521(-)